MYAEQLARKDVEINSLRAKDYMLSIHILIPLFAIYKPIFKSEDIMVQNITQGVAIKLCLGGNCYIE